MKFPKLRKLLTFTAWSALLFSPAVVAGSRREQAKEQDQHEAALKAIEQRGLEVGISLLKDIVMNPDSRKFKERYPEEYKEFERDMDEYNSEYQVLLSELDENFLTPAEKEVKREAFFERSDDLARKIFEIRTNQTESKPVENRPGQRPQEEESPTVKKLLNEGKKVIVADRSGTDNVWVQLELEEKEKHKDSQAAMRM